LASSPEVEGVSGRYFAKKAEARSSDASHEEGIARRLCEASIELTKVPAKKPAIIPRLSLDGSKRGCERTNTNRTPIGRKR
jgi:hypothetical protein